MRGGSARSINRLDRSVVYYSENSRARARAVFSWPALGAVACFQGQGKVDTRRVSRPTESSPAAAAGSEWGSSSVVGERARATLNRAAHEPPLFYSFATLRLITRFSCHFLCVAVFLKKKTCGSNNDKWIESSADARFSERLFNHDVRTNLERRAREWN